MKKGFVQLLVLFVTITSCKRQDSSVIIGQWETFGSSEYPSQADGLIYRPSVSFTYYCEYDFGNSGEGKRTCKCTRILGKNLDYTYTNEFKIKWSLQNNGRDSFIIFKEAAGKNLNIDGENRAKLEQDVEKEIYETNGTSDTIYFTTIDNNTMLCHFQNSKDEWKMTRKE